MLLVWLLVHPLVILGDDSSFTVPVESGLGVEYYDNGKSRFAIFMHRVSWHEARKLCPGRGGNLVEYLDDEVAAFIGRALAESAVGFTALWIGGEFIPSDVDSVDGKWVWINSEKPIETDLTHVTKFPMTSSPFWVDRPDPKARTPLCLATDRNMHHLALIVAEPCTKKQPYICVLPSVNHTNISVEIKPPLSINNKRFHLFQSAVTWEEALSQCRLIGMQLARVTTEEEFKMIGNRMIRSRPIVENAWISGIFTNGQWTWVSSNEPINVDWSKAGPGHPFPWYRPESIIMDGCLLADRHVCNHFVYVEAKCDRRRPFICEEVQDEAIPPAFVKVPGSDDYYISYIEETWMKAQNFCRACLGGHLLQIDDATQEGVATMLPLLYTAMGLTLEEEIRHIWVGGYLFKDKFKWSVDPDSEPGPDKELNAKQFEGLQPRGEKGRLIYCDDNFEQEEDLLVYKCLNMDREDTKKFFMYGLLCDVKQHFVCKAGPGAEIDLYCENGGLG